MKWPHKCHCMSHDAYPPEPDVLFVWSGFVPSDVIAVVMVFTVIWCWWLCACFIPPTDVSCFSPALYRQLFTALDRQLTFIAAVRFFFNRRPVRYVLHEQAQRCAKRYRILSAVNTAIETNGIKVMILLRLSPLVPFSGFNLMWDHTWLGGFDKWIGGYDLMVWRV